MSVSYRTRSVDEVEVFREAWTGFPLRERKGARRWCRRRQTGLLISPTARKVRSLNAYEVGLSDAWGGAAS